MKLIISIFYVSVLLNSRNQLTTSIIWAVVIPVTRSHYSISSRNQEMETVLLFLQQYDFTSSVVCPPSVDQVFFSCILHTVCEKE